MIMKESHEGMTALRICNKDLKLRLLWNQLHDFKVLMICKFWVVYVCSIHPSYNLNTRHPALMEKNRCQITLYYNENTYKDNLILI